MHRDIIKQPKREVLGFAISSWRRIALISGSVIRIVLSLVKLPNTYYRCEFKMLFSEELR
jgi:hypothetical protein